jgi:hypothetical protein
MLPTVADGFTMTNKGTSRDADIDTVYDVESFDNRILGSKRGFLFYKGAPLKNAIDHRPFTSPPPHPGKQKDLRTKPLKEEKHPFPDHFSRIFAVEPGQRKAKRK